MAAFTAASSAVSIRPRATMMMPCLCARRAFSATTAFTAPSRAASTSRLVQQQQTLRQQPGRRALSTLETSEGPAATEPVVQSSASIVPTAAERATLDKIKSQPSHYVKILLMGRRFLLTPRDVLTLPKLKGVQPGDRLSLTRILEVGSRDHALVASSPAPSAAITPLRPPLSTAATTGLPRDWQRHPDSLPFLSEGLVKVNATVLEHTKGKMIVVEKRKRRKGYRRTLRSKLEWTRVRVGDIVLL